MGQRMYLIVRNREAISKSNVVVTVSMDIGIGTGVEIAGASAK